MQEQQQAAAFQVFSICVGELQTNCYLFFNGNTKEGFIVDPGAEALRISRRIADLDMKPVAIVLTHGHFDHFGAAAELRGRYQIPVLIHEEDAKLLQDISANLSMPFMGTAMSLKADRILKDNEILELAGAFFTVLHTPGHTPGGISLYRKAEEAEGADAQDILFSGDTLFCESVGRTDFPGGDVKTLVRSICTRLLLALPQETVVYPGHNEATTIAHECQWNPAAVYLNHFTDGSC